MMTLETSITSYLSHMLDCVMTPRHERHGLSEHTKEISTLTISNGMFSHAGAAGMTGLKLLAESNMASKDPLSSKAVRLRVIRIDKVIDKVGLSRSTIYNLINEGRFPQRVRLGARAMGFYEHEIDTWMLQLGRGA